MFCKVSCNLWSVLETPPPGAPRTPPQTLPDAAPDAPGRAPVGVAAGVYAFKLLAAALLLRTKVPLLPA